MTDSKTSKLKVGIPPGAVVNFCASDCGFVCAQGLTEAKIDGKGLKIVIVRTRWNSGLVDALQQGTRELAISGSLTTALGQVLSRR